MNGSLKEILGTQCLSALFSQWGYVSIGQVKAWLDEHQVIYTSDTVTKYLFELRREKQFWDAGKGWYSKIKVPFKIDHTPVKKVVELLRSEFPNLDFSCWSTEQINRYLNHLLSSFATFVHVERGFEDEITQFLDARGWRVFRGGVGSRPDRSSPQAQTLFVQTLVSRSPSANGYALIEKILVDLRKETILPESEINHAIGTIVDSQRVQIGTLLSYAKRRNIRPELALQGSKSINSTFAPKVELMDSKRRTKPKNLHSQSGAQLSDLLQLPHLQSTLNKKGSSLLFAHLLLSAFSNDLTRRF